MRRHLFSSISRVRGPHPISEREWKLVQTTTGWTIPPDGKAQVAVARALHSVGIEFGGFKSNKELVELILKPARRGLYSSEHIVNDLTCLIRGYGKNLLADEANWVFRQLQEFLQSEIPPIQARQAIINANSAAGNLHQALHYFYEYSETNTVSLVSAALAACMRNGSPEKCEEVAASLRPGFLQINKNDREVQACRALLISALGRLQKPEEARKLVYSLPSPQVSDFTALITCEPSLDKVMEHWRQIQAHRLVPNTQTLSAILMACHKHLDLPRALQVFEDFREYMDEETLSLRASILLKICAETGEWRTARQIEERLGLDKIRAHSPRISYQGTEKQASFIKSEARKPHPLIQKLYLKLRELGFRLDYTALPVTLRKAHPRIQVDSLLSHMELRALGMILQQESGVTNSVIRIKVNLTMCASCQSFMRASADYLQRTILVNDIAQTRVFGRDLNALKY